MMRKLGFYGKGGIGKSTVVCNLSVLFARSARVLQFGCDPKSDSTQAMTGGPAATVMDAWMQYGDGGLKLEHFLVRGRDGVACIEAGGPAPGTGCAGRGITKAFELIGDVDGLQQQYDVVLFDVLGDVVCGGFSAPMRSGYADEIFIVTSGEARSLYAANNLCWAVRQNARNGARLCGIVGNLRGVPDEERLLAGFAERIGTAVVGMIPRDDAVALAERTDTPVVAYAPQSAAARAFEALHDRIADPGSLTRCTPAPIARQSFRDALLRFFA